ncbi:uncharacterized protein TNCV_1503151 [Trichonephila clavipes]|uniref:Uncharacterized protein n=1 Tax=Trichonephila clavipes TaxID=2585209 RepID=A0A8X6RTE4_TRICX|nr:uncharacterized protein TNCV_1503151 [Trichonephila clavipes]
MCLFKKFISLGWPKIDKRWCRIPPWACAVKSSFVPVTRNTKDLEVFCVPTEKGANRVCLLSVKTDKKKLELGMSEEALVEHIFVTLEPQVQDYVEVRNPQNTVQLLEVISKFEERYSSKAMRGIVIMLKDEVGMTNGGQKDDFSRGNHRNRAPSENFSQGDRRQRGRLNVLKVSDDQNDQTQSANEVPIKLSAICMSPVELPYVPILLNDTFTKTLRDTGVEKFDIISKEGIKTDETKVRAIVELKPPRNSKEVSKFLEAQKTFYLDKAAITKAPVLKSKDFKKAFRVIYGCKFNRCRIGSKSGAETSSVCLSTEESRVAVNKTTCSDVNRALSPH